MITREINDITTVEKTELENDWSLSHDKLDNF